MPRQPPPQAPPPMPYRRDWTHPGRVQGTASANGSVPTAAAASIGKSNARRAPPQSATPQPPSNTSTPPTFPRTPSPTAARRSRGMPLSTPKAALALQALPESAALPVHLRLPRPSPVSPAEVPEGRSLGPPRRRQKRRRRHHRHEQRRRRPHRAIVGAIAFTRRATPARGGWGVVHQGHIGQEGRASDMQLSPWVGGEDRLRASVFLTRCAPALHPSQALLKTQSPEPGSTGHAHSHPRSCAHSRPCTRRTKRWFYTPFFIRSVASADRRTQPGNET